jgi:chromosome segregation ATPase
MPAEHLETITLEQFNQRLDASNESLRQQLAEAQARVQRLEALIARKELFAQRLTQMLAEIEREEGEIADLEKDLRPSRAPKRRRTSPSQAS